MVYKPKILEQSCGCSRDINDGTVLIEDNIMYTSPNRNDCSKVFDSYRKVCAGCVHNLSDIKNDYRFKQNIEQNNHLQNGYSLLDTVIDLTNDDDEILTFDLCDTDYINKNSLVTEDTNAIIDCTVSSESSDDDVIFVKEFKYNAVDESQNETEKVVETIRRNPVRTVRNKVRNLIDETFFEEDFSFLDSRDEEVKKDTKKICKNPTPPKFPKEWPINVYERPEYNPVTNTIEPFDYTIRAIQEAMAIKPKRKRETKNEDVKRKPWLKKSKIAIPKDINLHETVSLDPLKPLISNTSDMLKQFFEDVKKREKLAPSNTTIENKVEVLRNQSILFAIVNNLGEEQVVDKFKHLDLCNNEVIINSGPHQADQVD